jgi:hypothetical protein
LIIDVAAPPAVSIDTEGKRCDIGEKDFGGLLGGLLGGVTREDSNLNGRAICDGPVRVNRLVGLLAVAVEDVRNELDNMGDMSGREWSGRSPGRVPRNVHG